MHEEIFRNNPHVSKIIRASFFSAPWDYLMYTFQKRKFLATNYGNLCTSLYYRKKKAVDVIAEMLDVDLVDRTLEVYLTEEEEKAAQQILAAYPNPVIIHVTSITTKNQEWPFEQWERLVAETPEFTFIQLGLAGEYPVKGAISFLGKTSFRLGLALMKHALGFVGVVSSFAHATNAVDIRGVVLFGASTPEIWGHENNINLYKHLPCAPCVDLLLSSRCPYNKTCMRSITVSEVKDALSRQVSVKRSSKTQAKLSIQASKMQRVQPRPL